MKQKFPLLVSLSALALSACSVDLSNDDDDNSNNQTNTQTLGSVYIKGAVTQGETLTAAHNLIDADGDVSVLGYQWQQDGQDIEGATEPTLTLTQAHVGGQISVTLEVTDGVEAAQAFTSSQTNAILNVNEQPTGDVMVMGATDGIITAGDTVTASQTLADMDGIDESSLTYSWVVDDVEVATGESFTAEASHAPGALLLTVTYTDNFDNQHSVDSAQYQIIPDVSAYTCPENDASMYFCDDFEDGTFDDKWTDLISTYGLDSPGVFDVLDNGYLNALRFTAGTRSSVLGEGELILVKPEAFADVPNDYALEYKIRPRDNGNTGNKYLYSMVRYDSQLNWYFGGLNVQGSTTSTQLEAGYASSADQIQRESQVKYPIELGTRNKLDDPWVDDGTWYTVRVDVVGNTLTTYINGEQKGSWTDDQALYNDAGLIGFFTYNRSFEIDHIKVFDPAIKPVQLALSFTDTSWITAADGDALVVNVTAIQNDGTTEDTFTVVSSDDSIVEASIDGSQVTLTPKAPGDVEITFTSESDNSVQRVIKATIEPAWNMPTTDYGSVNGTVSPELGAMDQYIDDTFSIEFDNDDFTLGTTGEVRIFDDSGEIVDRIKASGEVDNVGLTADDRSRVLNREMLTIEGSTLHIRPHNGVLDYGQTYTITIGDNVVMGAKLNGMDFNGLGENAAWEITTKASGPADGTTELTVDDDGDADFRSVQGALNWVMRNLDQATPATINIKNGTYDELLYLRNKDNLTLSGESRDGTHIAAENYDGLNTGSSSRALFLVEGGDLLTIENLSITNTHTRTGGGDQAETIYFNSKTGRLIARNSNFTSEQDTLLMKGYNWFYDSKISGNVDFIWGYSVATVFENSEIVTLGDSKQATSDGSAATSSGGYLLQARVENETDPGFVFLNSTLTSDVGPKNVSVEDGSTYLARSGGDTSKFDNIVFVNTKMGPHIADIGWAYQGINDQPAPTPLVASAASGWREYNTMDLDGNVMDLSGRCDANGNCYELTQEEYQANFCSRAQIFAGFNNGEGWDPYPEDTSDDSCAAPTAEAWKASNVVLGGSTTSVDGSITSQSDDAVTFSASGGKFETSKVSFYLVSQDITGDFTLTAKLKSIDGGILRENSSFQFPAGLMMCVCDGTAATVGQLAHVGVNDVNGDAKTLGDGTVDYVASYGHFLSASADAGWGKTGSAVVTPGDDLYFRLRREGNAYYVYYSTDGGVTYGDHYGANTFESLPDTLKVGFFAAPNGSSNEPTFMFEDISIEQ